MSNAPISLQKITADTVRAICALKVAPEQASFVAANAVSIAQAYFEPKAWFRAIYAGDEPVGFLMIEADEVKAEYFLWRLMVAEGHQRKGVGRRAIELLVEHVRARPSASELLVSYGPGEHGPAGFYQSLGFVETGEVEEGELVCRLAL